LTSSQRYSPGKETSSHPSPAARTIPSDRAAERYQYISNNSEGMKRIAFDLRGLRDFEIDGAGTELLFSGFVSPFSIEECERVPPGRTSLEAPTSRQCSRAARTAGTASRSASPGARKSFR